MGKHKRRRNKQRNRQTAVKRVIKFLEVLGLVTVPIDLLMIIHDLLQTSSIG